MMILHDGHITPQEGENLPEELEPVDLINWEEWNMALDLAAIVGAEAPNVGYRVDGSRNADEQGVWYFSHYTQRCDKCGREIPTSESYLRFQKHNRRACEDCALHGEVLRDL